MAESERIAAAVLHGALEGLRQIADSPSAAIIASLRHLVPQYAAPDVIPQPALRVVSGDDDETALTADDQAAYVAHLDAPPAARPKTRLKAA